MIEKGPARRGQLNPAHCGSVAQPDLVLQIPDLPAERGLRQPAPSTLDCRTAHWSHDGTPKGVKVRRRFTTGVTRPCDADCQTSACGVIAGFIAVLAFRQSLLAAFVAVGAVSATHYSLAPAAVVMSGESSLLC
jgi:hypothetical protein